MPPPKAAPLRRTLAIRAFLEARHSKSGPAFRRLLATTRPSPELEEVHQALIGCGHTQSREFAGQTYSKTQRCGLPYCPSCARRSRSREAKAVVKKIAAKAPSVTAEHVSFITLHGGLAPLGADLRPIREALAKQVHNVMRRHLQGCALSLSLQVAIRLDDQAHLHAHGVLVHQGRNRAEVTAVLKQAFPESRAVQVQAPETQDWAKEWFRTEDERGRRVQGGEGFGSYSADMQIRVKQDRADLPELVMAYISSVESLRSSGRKGLRIQSGMNGKTVAQRVAPKTSREFPVMALIRRLREKQNSEKSYAVPSVMDQVLKDEGEQNTPLLVVLNSSRSEPMGQQGYRDGQRCSVDPRLKQIGRGRVGVGDDQLKDLVEIPRADWATRLDVHQPNKLKRHHQHDPERQAGDCDPLQIRDDEFDLFPHGDLPMGTYPPLDE